MVADNPKTHGIAGCKCGLDLDEFGYTVDYSRPTKERYSKMMIDFAKIYINGHLNGSFNFFTPDVFSMILAAVSV